MREIPIVVAPPDRAPKGRGTAWTIAHRFERDPREPFDDGWPPGGAGEGASPPVRTEVNPLPDQALEGALVHPHAQARVPHSDMGDGPPQ